MTPTTIQTGDNDQQVVRLQLSTGIVSIAITIIVLLLGGAAAFNQKTNRSDVKEIVDDKIAPVNQKYDQILKAVDQINAKLDRIPNVSR